MKRPLPTALLARIRGLFDGFWLVPGAVAASLAVLAFALVELDRAVGNDAVSFAFGGDASAARSILQTIAGSLITVAGLTFSLTVVVLSLVSGQFTPRSIPAFLADRVTQVTAGAFIGIFTYCLIVLRTVRDEEDGGQDGFVPELAITTSVGLAVLAVGLLLFFIHHLGVSIQASSIVARIGKETLERIDTLPDEPAGDAAEPPGSPGVVASGRTGYVRHVALDQLAERTDGVCEHVRVCVTPGDFVTERDALAEIWPQRAAADAERHVRGSITIGIERDLRQDVLYGVRQLAEIAMKGLSPGVNDPATAVSAFGYLRAILERLAEQPLPAVIRRDRAVAPLRSFEDYVQGAFEQVGRYASRDASVVVSLLDALAAVADTARPDRPERLGMLVATAEAIAAPALEDARTDRDREHIRAALARVTP